MNGGNNAVATYSTMPDSRKDKIVDARKTVHRWTPYGAVVIAGVVAHDTGARNLKICSRRQKCAAR